MPTFSKIRTNISMLTNGHVSTSDIEAIINRVHQEEVESFEWHYRVKNMNFASAALKTAGTISVASGATTVYGTGTGWEEADIGKHIRIGDYDDTMPIEVADVALFPDALNFTEYTVTNAAVVTIGSAFGGVLATRGTFTVLGGNIRYTIDGTTPTTTTGHQVIDGSQFVLDGNTNLAAFQMIAESTDAAVSVTTTRETQELTLATAWPAAAISGGSYELFQRYYTLPADVEVIQQVNHVDYTLPEMTVFQLDMADPTRNERSDKGRHFARAGVNSSGQKLIELWPTTTEVKLYGVQYLAGHTDMTADTDRPLVPVAVLENRALVDACAVTFAKTGDKRWLDLGDKFEKRYATALERLASQDPTRMGKLAHMLDLESAGYGSWNYSYPYMVDHDV